METGDLLIYYKESVKDITEELLLDGRAWYNHVLNLPVHLQVVYTTLIFHKQVFNGGLHQYFFNGYGMFANQTIENLDRIGASGTKEILSNATNKVNEGQHDKNQFSEMIIDRKFEALLSFDDTLCDYLDSLSNEYYSTEENIHALLVDYLIKYEAHFHK